MKVLSPISISSLSHVGGMHFQFTLPKLNINEVFTHYSINRTCLGIKGHTCIQKTSAFQKKEKKKVFTLNVTESIMQDSLAMEAKE